MSVARVLVVGYGSIGQRHARLAREALPDARIAVLRRQPASAGDGVADAFLDSIDDAIAFRPEAAVIAGPSPHHIAPALALAEAGAHLLVEKPIADRADKVPALIAVCRARRRVLMAGYNLRFHPSLGRFRKMIMEGRAGRILSVRAEVGQYLPTWRPDADYRQTVSARAELGGGVLLELSHEIDYLRWIFGEVEWVSATNTRQSDLEIDVEDTAHLIIGFAGTRPRQLVASVNLDFVRHDRTRSCVAIGDRGSLRWDALAGRISWFGAGASDWTTESEQPPVRDESYRAEWKEFLACIASGATPTVTGDDALRTLQVVETARESGVTGCVARMPSPGLPA